MRLNSRAWIIWVLVVSVLAMSARNPLYSIILLVLSITAIQFYARTESPIRSVFFRIALGVILFSAIYHALFIHTGDHVIFELPDYPLIGGVITVEAIVDGLRNGLVLITLIAVFMALNSIVPSRELVRLVPAAFQDLAVVVMIAVTYVPETRRHLRRIQQAQAIRGHRPHGLKDWRPLIIPLLVGGLERAMKLSEAMVARGYVSEQSVENRAPDKVFLITGLLLALVGWMAAMLWGTIGYLLLTLGGLILLMLLARRGKRTRRTSFVAVRWSAIDTILVITSLAALALVVAPWPGLRRVALSYIPYPALHVPNFQPIVAIAFVLLSFPIFLAVVKSSDPDSLGKRNQKPSTAGGEIRQMR
ncbi:MAG TPA: energy-coupling factor transporter transmembrane component T [candidate division Zixibacteria bacterium]|nr:energy-coupling factor transporter transmembrane component T [candidate division Zixibacteria bacterium]